MRLRTASTAAALAAALLATACAIRLGGPAPLGYRTLAIAAAEGEAPDSVARRIRSADAKVVLLTARADSAWFAEVARLSDLVLSGPGNAGTTSLAFLGSEPLGDTTIALPVEGGRPIVVHDALYKLDNYRYLDLIIARIEPGTEARPAVRALTNYVATDVMSNAAVALAVDSPDAAIGDSIAALLRPLFADARTCLASPANGVNARARVRVHLFHGPEARIGCENARLIQAADGDALVARLVVHR
ncbi:MAG TPA: hypothetical protein VIL18_02650 [Longimicrobiales bacterium]